MLSDLILYPEILLKQQNKSGMPDITCAPLSYMQIFLKPNIVDINKMLQG